MTPGHCKFQSQHFMEPEDPNLSPKIGLLWGNQREQRKRHVRGKQDELLCGYSDHIKENRGWRGAGGNTR